MSESSSDIASLLNPRYVRRVSFLPNALSWFVVVAGCLSLFAWATHLTLLKRVDPDWISMKPNSAVAMILVGAALLLRMSREKQPRMVLLARAFGVLVAVIGALTLLEFLGLIHFSFDSLIFSEPDRYGIRFPGRMSVLTALDFLLAGIALSGSLLRQRRGLSFPHVLAFLVALFALLPFIGYLYGSRFTIGVATYGEMAPDTAICFFAIAIAILFSRIDHDLAAILLSDGPGGILARRLLPIAILLPFLFGLVRIIGEDRGILSVSFGTALFATVTIASFFAFIWVQSISIQRVELVRMEADRERERVRIEAELRERFVSMLSHDLRTPLTTASAYAQLIQKSPENAVLCRRNAEGVIRSLARTDRMIQDLLDVKRIQAGQAMEIVVVKADFWVVVDETIKELTTIHGNRFTLRRAGDLIGYWDVESIRRALENLCNNAVKYGDSQKVIGVTVESLGERIRISVHNEGRPIPLQEIASLFDPFTRVRSAGKRGWGLGLAQVRAIAEAHGGNVEVSSSEALGTTFTVELPRDCRAPKQERPELASG